MKAIRIRLLAAVVLAAAFLFIGEKAAAQQNRSLRISDGEVYVDGRRIPHDDLPPGLRTEGVTVHYTFSGDVRPVVQVGGHFYVLDGSRLRVADPDEPGTFVGPPALREFTAPDVQVEFRDAPPEAMEPPAPPHAVVFERKAEKLREQAVRMQELQQVLQQQAHERQNAQAGLQERVHEAQMRELEEVARQVSLHAAEAARMADDLPRLELETYLQDMQQKNAGLFDQLVNERELEQRTLETARQIREMAEGPERQEQIDALHRQLDDIFELKQENRRREVEQLEGRLEDLQEKIEERERLREEIVERRLRQLLREGDLNW